MTDVPFVLSVANAVVRYGSRLVLDDISLEVAAGERFALLGPNGAGKTTLLRLLGGLLKPASGRVLLQGRDLAAWPPQERARMLAGVPQQVDTAIPLRVGDLVATGRLPHAGDWAALGEADHKAMAEALAAMDMAGQADRFLHELSAGERQRAWLAMALAQQANVLLLDEPTSHLDIHHAWHLMELLADWACQRRLTVVFSTHDLNLAAAFCSRVALLRDGRIEACGTPVEVLQSDRLSAVFSHPLEVRLTGDSPGIVPRRGRG